MMPTGVKAIAEAGKYFKGDLPSAYSKTYVKEFNDFFFAYDAVKGCAKGDCELGGVVAEAGELRVVCNGLQVLWRRRARTFVEYIDHRVETIHIRHDTKISTKP